MKKSILFSVLTVAVSIFNISTADAQEGFYIGIQGAQQVSGMFNQDDIDADNFTYKMTPGQTFGLGGGYNFNRNMGVAVEAMYSIEGQKYELNGTMQREKLSYVKVPMLFSYNTNPDAKVMFTAKAGPQAGMLVKASLKDGDGEVLVEDTKDNYKTFTFGAVVGAGARINLAKNLYFDAGLRLDGNFSNSEEPVMNEVNVAKAKTYNMNAGIELGLKYFFN